MGLEVITQLGLTIHASSGKVFSVGKDLRTTALPPTPGYQHRIVLKRDATPIKHKLRRLSLSVKNEVSKELQKLLDHDRTY